MSQIYHVDRERLSQPNRDDLSNKHKHKRQAKMRQDLRRLIANWRLALIRQKVLVGSFQRSEYERVS